MRYLDSSQRVTAMTLYGWLSDALVDGTRAVRCQSGFFSADGIAPFEAVIINMLAAGGLFRFVLGGNAGASSQEDIEYLLDLADAHSRVELRLVWPRSQLLFHPKTFHVTMPDRSVGLVGSANWTYSALGRNVEAGIAVDDAVPSDAVVVEDIRTAIDQWFVPGNAYSNPVLREELPLWRARGVIAARAPRAPAAGAAAGPVGGGAWMPAATTVPRRRPRRRAPPAAPPPAAPRATVPPVAPVPIGHGVTLPGGAIGVIKPLVTTDLRGINAKVGTWYFSLPMPLSAYLPLAAPAPHRDRTVSIAVEARLASAPEETVVSGEAPTNVTLVGSAPAATSHRNLRMNLLSDIAKGLRGRAAESGVGIPVPGDLACLEFLDLDPVVVRVTFVGSADASYVALKAAAAAHVIPLTRGIGWMLAGDRALLPAW